MKNIIITGANGNLGTAVVQKFLDGDYRVIATVSNENAIGSFEVHPHLEVQAIDLTNEADTSGFIQQMISKHKTIDAALMLAGGFTPGNITNATGDDLRKQYALNFETAYYITRPLFGHMMEVGYGRLVFVGARPAMEPNAGKSLMAYSLSKSLLFKLAENLNAEAKGTNVTATVMVPSTIDTAANRSSMPDANFSNWVKPSAIADLLEVICSEKGNVLRETVMKVYGNS